MRGPEFAVGGIHGRAGKDPVPGPDYDVIVVGARVAGASTAMLLARRGHRVLMVERASMPSDVVSTHAILRTGVLQLSRWGLLDRVIEAETPPIHDITLGFGGQRISFQVRSEYGIDTLYAPRRHVLDSILVDAAQDSGADFAGRTRMVDLLRASDGEVRGVVLKRRNQEMAYTARMVIGADGVWSRTAELTDARLRRSHPATNEVSYAYFRDIDVPGFWFQFTPGVNAGIVPTNDGLACVFAGRHKDRVPEFRADADTEFHRLLQEAGPDLASVVSAGTRVGNFRGADLPGFVREAWGPGWALVGDAGYTKDPISAHGISDALRDAELCARAVDEALRRPDHAEEAMSEYERLRDRLSGPIYRQSQALARYQWDAAEASERMRVISDAVRAECDVLTSLEDWAPALV